MEFTKLEDAAIQEANSRTESNMLVELADAQLAIVGGGVGEVGLN